MKRVLKFTRRLLETQIRIWLLPAVLAGAIGSEARGQEAAALSPSAADVVRPQDPNFVPVPSVIRDLNSPAENLRQVTQELETAEAELRAPHPVLYDFLKARSDMQAKPADRRLRARYERKFAEAVELLHQRCNAITAKEGDMLKAIQRVSEEATSKMEQVEEQMKQHATRIATSAEQIKQHTNTLRELKQVNDTAGELSDDQISDARAARNDLEAEHAVQLVAKGTARTIEQRKAKLETILDYARLNANSMRVRFRSAHNDLKVLDQIASLRFERAENQVTDAEMESVLASLEMPALHGPSGPAPLSQLQNMIDESFSEDSGSATANENASLRAMEQEFRNVDALFDLPELKD